MTSWRSGRNVHRRIGGRNPAEQLFGELCQADRMTVPSTGGLILLIGVWLFFCSPRHLYALMIIAIPFSATAVVNVAAGGEEKGVAAWMFLGGLWILREVISTDPLWHKIGWFSSRRTRGALLAFGVAVIASLCVPLVLNGTAWVPNPVVANSGMIPLRFGPYNLTQTGYLFFGVLLAIFIAAECHHSSRIYYTMKLYIASCTFAAVWGLFEFWCGLTGYAYPAYLFNTSADASALGYKQALALNFDKLGRVSSVALEPSVLAEELLIALVVLLVSSRLRRHILPKKWGLISITLILCVLFVSTSSTAYVGILIAFFLAAVVLSSLGKPSKIYFLAGAGILLAAVIAVSTIPLVRQAAELMIFNKLDVGSGFERFHSVILAAQDFMRFPILGTGWHAVTSWDLAFLLLANTGIVGFTAFFHFVIPVVRGLWTSARARKPAAVALLPTILLTLILAEVAGLTYAAGYVWLVFGLSAGALAASQTEELKLHSSSIKTYLDQQYLITL